MIERRVGQTQIRRNAYFAPGIGETVDAKVTGLVTRIWLDSAQSFSQ